jgi:5-methylcytosine-specific restriction protein A
MFQFNREYHRKSELHDIYGGQQRGGIATPSKHPIVLLFTSDNGEQYGYHDDFVNGIFHYTGEGQNGDMQMNKGNRAILEHAQSGKALHLFEYTRKGYVEYIGEAECLGFEEVTRPDVKGNDRKAFVFHLDLSAGIAKGVQTAKPGYIAPQVKQLKKKSIQQLRAAALEPAMVNAEPKEKKQLAFYRSEALKLYVIARSKGVCEGCGEKAPFNTKSGPYLECHHVHRLADGGPDHPENVVALCPNCHRRAHYATDARIFNQTLQQIALEKEKNN